MGQASRQSCVALDGGFKAAFLATCGLVSVVLFNTKYNDLQSLTSVTDENDNLRFFPQKSEMGSLADRPAVAPRGSSLSISVGRDTPKHREHRFHRERCSPVSGKRFPV